MIFDSGLLFWATLYFGAKLTKAVHHRWFSGGYREKTDLRLLNFRHNFIG